MLGRFSSVGSERLPYKPRRGRQNPVKKSPKYNQDCTICRSHLHAPGVDRAPTPKKRLCKKLGEDADNPAYLFNEHGVGYRMPDPDEGWNRPGQTSPCWTR